MNEETIRLGIHRVNNKVLFMSTGSDQPPVPIDSYPPFGDGSGYTPLELLLLSYESCTSMALISLLTERMRRTIVGLDAQATGYLKSEHPKSFSRIELSLSITSPDVTEAEVERALASAEQKICPVWDMIRGNVAVSVTFTIQR